MDVSYELERGDAASITAPDGRVVVVTADKPLTTSDPDLIAAAEASPVLVRCQSAKPKRSNKSEKPAEPKDLASDEAAPSLGSKELPE